MRKINLEKMNEKKKNVDAFCRKSFAQVALCHVFPIQLAESTEPPLCRLLN